MAMRIYVSSEEAAFFNNNKMGYADSIPTTGSYKVGDFIISSTQLDGIFGWVCTEEGTPGKWEVIGSGAGGGKLVSVNASKLVDTAVNQISIAELGLAVSSKDKLIVHFNSMFLMEGVDYQISTDGSTITKLGEGNWNESNIAGCLFTFEVLKNVENVDTEEIKLDSKLICEKNNVTVASAVSEVNIGINGFDKSKDLLTVYKNATYLIEGVDYDISADSSKIVSLNGVWNENVESDYIFTFVVFKEVVTINPDAVVNTEHIVDGSVTMDKLSGDVKQAMSEEITASRGSYDWLPDRLDNFDSQLEYNTNNSNCINVKNYGAKGDGVTDDTISIQNAINELKNKNIKSYLLFEKDKTYIINESLVIDFSNIVIEGNNSVLTTTSSILNVFFLNGDSTKEYYGYDGNINIEFKNLTLNGNGVVDTGIGISHSKNLIVSNCKFIDFTSHCLDLAGINGVVVENNSFEGFSGEYNLHREAVQIDVCISSTFPHFGAYDKTPTINVVVKNNTFEESENNPIWGKCIGCHTISDNGMYKNIKIYDNKLKAKEACISFMKTEFKNIEIFNNTFTSDEEGILLEGTPNGWTSPKEDLEQIKIYNNRCLASKNFIKIMTYSNYIKGIFIDNNDVKFYEHGVYIVFYGALVDLKEDNISDVIIKNNKFDSYGDSVSEALQTERITNLFIKSNSFNNILSTCIQINYTKNCIINDNIMNDIKGHGIELKGDLYDVNVNNNIIKNTNRYGVLCGYGSSSSDLIKICNNTLINIGMFNANSDVKRGIGVFASNNVDIKNNIVEITDNTTNREYCPDTLIYLESTCVNSSITDNVLNGVLLNHPYRALIVDKNKKAFVYNNLIKTDGYENYSYTISDESGTLYKLKVIDGSLAVEPIE